MKTDNPLEGSDTAIYPELSRANLLRMRSDYAGAAEQCLAILRRYPNNSTVHTLLGDIYAEQDELEQASQWYELALDLNPRSASDQGKLAAVRERMRHKETSTSAEQLGLPTASSRRPIFAVAMVLLIVAVTAMAYFAGKSTQPLASSRRIVDDAITAPVPDAPTNSTTDSSSVATTNGPSPSKSPIVDRELAAMLSQRSTAASNLLSVQSDPRNHNVTVTYSVTDSEDEKRVGAELAKAVLEQSQETIIVTLRAVRGDRITYMADAPRSRYQEIDASTTITGDAWMDRLLTNEWPTRTAQTTGTNSTENP